MAPANDVVFQRRNKQIQDAIDGQNLKQALQLIEKRMKKGEDSRFLKAWKAHILFKHTDEAHRQRGIVETLDLCKTDPPTTDLDTLDILYQTLENLSGHEETMRSLWEKASKAKPQDLELQTRWFTYAFEAEDWKSAQKAAMSLQINFPKTRKYYFWAIFLSYLVSTDAKSSEADKKLFGMLAYRMVSKAADTVPSDPKELLSHPKAIQNAEELLLLIKIFDSQGHPAEIVKILDTANLGLNSKIVQNDWNFIREKVLGLEKAKMWSDGLSYAKSLLPIPTNEADRKALQEHDDWTVWSLMVSAVREINTPETTAETQRYIEDFIKAEQKSRNAQLARIDLIHWRVQSGSLAVTDLLSASQEYFKSNKRKLYCFMDLQKYLSALDQPSVSKFVEHIFQNLGDETPSTDKNDPFKGVATINALKLEYCFQISSHSGDLSKEKAEDFIARCLKAYKDMVRSDKSSEPSTIESRPSDDLFVLAAMCLIRFGQGQVDGPQDLIPNTVLIRAAGILERLIVDSPHNYQALLFLVRIYLRLGAGSLALKTFSKLSVKQIQYETVAHNLFTRLASIHPHSAPPIEGAEYKDFNPQSAFVQALNFYRNANITTGRHRTNGLDYGSYVNVEGSIELQRRLNQSICRKIYAFEARRTQRLTGGDPMSRYDELAKEDTPLVDQRQFDAFMNCEVPNTTTFEELMRLGPLPRDQWIKSARITDSLFDILRCLALQKPTTQELAPPSLEHLLGSDAQSEMTSTEIENVKIHLQLLKVATFMAGSKAVASADVDCCLAETEKWLNSTLGYVSSNDGKPSTLTSKTGILLRSGTPSAPSWTYFHEAFSILETLMAISSLASISNKKAVKSVKLPKDKVEILLSLARDIHEKIRADARALKSRISESGMLSTLVELIQTGNDEHQEEQLQAELADALDTSDLEIFCGTLMESWEEGLDGVLAVTL
ncbi:hypothetical protein ASPZODRAFT_134775 [Penicilliopsis zonata CBS 506.65]|uniref:N-acetyltransferase B complex non catalytic subunit n=1 Tax=Penicilliopsis zonata CBS 506.65 TaxID=1073090 RepID=A0A1L9SC64_9EURO|nr:hypothetical protein ASPZODRAFT_134775 [Penicilliopsis zonata CBS 506.65]OJJ44687.1 hypothetical protein ASPZODRAFT_134775 [Penicilliopsis zonata CBS 506.65]